MELKPSTILTGYCTKYALTKGIIITRVLVASNTKYVTGMPGGGVHGCFMTIGVNFFIDKAAAENKAKQLACDKRRSLAMQQSKIAVLCVKPKYFKVK